MLWNFYRLFELKMKNLKDEEIKNYLKKIPTKNTIGYGVYQVEAEGLNLFEYIKGDKNSIMGLPVKHIKDYIKNYKL